MFEIIPNWHPFFVHFTIGLLLASVLFFSVSHFARDEKAKGRVLTAGKWMLWTGALFTIVTVATGFYAFATVAHDDPSHLAMKDHRLWALGTASLFVVLAGISFFHERKDKPLAGWFTPVLVIGAVLLGVTGYKGGELVYRHGLGVMSLPQAEGEGHSHDGDDDHGATVPESDQPVETVTYDPASPAGVVNAFHAALNVGDVEAVKAILSPEVMIYESGYVENSREEYEGHHMPADMAFSRNMTRTILRQTMNEDGNSAIVVTESQTQGSFRDKDYNLMGLETMVLEMTDGEWKIIHIHWSSRDAG